MPTVYVYGYLPFVLPLPFHYHPSTVVPTNWPSPYTLPAYLPSLRTTYHAFCPPDSATVPLPLQFPCPAPLRRGNLALPFQPGRLSVTFTVCPLPVSASVMPLTRRSVYFVGAGRYLPLLLRFKRRRFTGWLVPCCLTFGLYLPQLDYCSFLPLRHWNVTFYQLLPVVRSVAYLILRYYPPSLDYVVPLLCVHCSGWMDTAGLFYR